MYDIQSLINAILSYLARSLPLMMVNLLPYTPNKKSKEMELNNSFDSWIDCYRLRLFDRGYDCDCEVNLIVISPLHSFPVHSTHMVLL